jgi:hypothetical protein
VNPTNSTSLRLVLDETTDNRIAAVCYATNQRTLLARVTNHTKHGSGPVSVGVSRDMQADTNLRFLRSLGRPTHTHTQGHKDTLSTGRKRCSVVLTNQKGYTKHESQTVPMISKNDQSTHVLIFVVPHSRALLSNAAAQRGRVTSEDPNKVSR